MYRERVAASCEGPTPVVFLMVGGTCAAGQQVQAGNAQQGTRPA